MFTYVLRKLNSLIEAIAGHCGGDGGSSGGEGNGHCKSTPSKRVAPPSARWE